MKSKLKKCRVKGCENTFTPYNSLVKWCSPNCGVILAKEAQEKARKAEVKAFNRETRERKQKAKKLSEWRSEAQAAFNRYIRARDIKAFRDKCMEPECISCGTTNPLIQYCAGHFYTRAARPELAFHEDNVHLQCNNYCNQQLSANIEAYRPRLIEKIGQERFDALSTYHAPKKYTIEDYKKMKVKYSRMAKEIIDAT